MAISLSQRRIDAIGFSTYFIDIIEITLNAGLTALGQLIAYPILYRQAYPTTLSLRPVLVCQSIQSDMRSIYDSAGIIIFQFEPEENSAYGPRQGQMESAP